MSTRFDVTLPQGIPADIQVLSGSLSELDDGSWVDVLTREEHDRRASFKNEARRRLFTLGRLVLRRHLGARLGMDPRDVPIDIHESGRLVLAARGVRDRPGPQGPQLQISLAHSGSCAVAACALRQIGVDIEVMKPRTDRLLDYITHPDERPHLDRLAPTPNEQLHAAWTIKEAVLKGIGTGLRTGPRRLLISPERPVPLTTPPVPGPDWHRATVLDTDDRTWSAVYRLANGYATAIAWQ